MSIDGSDDPKFRSMLPVRTKRRDPQRADRWDIITDDEKFRRWQEMARKLFEEAS